MIAPMVKGSFWLALAGAVLLTGCVSVQQQQAAVPAVVAPRPVAVAPMPGRIPPVIQKTAASGVPIILDGANSVDPSCHSSGVPTARVTQPPVHGSVELLQQDAFPNFPPSNPRAACNKIKVPSVVTKYKSEPGFVGSDFTVVDMIFPDGKEAEVKFAITVK